MEKKGGLREAGLLYLHRTLANIIISMVINDFLPHSGKARRNQNLIYRN